LCRSRTGVAGYTGRVPQQTQQGSKRKLSLSIARYFLSTVSFTSAVLRDGYKIMNI